MKREKIGFVGTGVMGKSMARHLMDAGYTLNVFTRTKEKAVELLDQGANWKDSIAALAKDSDIIITIVGYPSDVESIYFGEHGLLENAKPGSYVIDMTTSSPLLAQDIHKQAKEKGIHALDAPVSGGDVGAQKAALTIMAGGDTESFQAIQPVFEIMGQNIVLQGEAGAGQHTKMCNQIAIASGMLGVTEAILYAEKAGLDPETVLKSIEFGAAGSWSLSNLGPRMIRGDFAPGFYVKHFIKDMKIAIESAEQMELPVPGLKLAKELYDKLNEAEGGNDGTQALLKYYRIMMA
ncbi:3-hydroxyisobutyrate dehydrogenase [Halobacillus karajensis]|uniref:2-hydroxy-3-oxopropionate reductase n=2 Tax=Halobacillus karajensis TaxID=195088 RepID=A0A024P7P7_9BACI|nr:2-hydroxy-3-oxopropionate reductase [Halobacillus karajensis]CDQ25144.1 2-hydroxy-3-oxopropionate reductase [Halobacillus karajensis]CDQ28495.1 2-hydroxy-3-oxopropionate reductase [Halobacillus karajensis]SEI01786.1 3-hydroxyisobutyrate dehydrogenase [Halobacillus karajensis]